MLRPRVIPCLLVHENGLVKTVRFQDPKYVGDPINAVKIFNEKEADELVVLDIDATVQGREPNFRLIGQFAAECRMPLCYGGGVTSAEQAKRIIALGVEKVALSAAALARPALIGEIAEEIGRQSVVVVVDAQRKLLGGWEARTHNAKRASGRSVVDWAVEAAERGAGEIVINSIDHDGAMKGYDIGLARKVREAIRVPMSVIGGAGSHEDLARLVEACGVVGAVAGSLFVFKGVYRAVLINYPNPAQKEQIIAAARA
ncbi:MAG: AglZ/HisF2 family acetamidino modification protein [Rubrivivax sp.]|jgi:cyclase|nr:AglZ/HisF2 family acetamidino modification protein [Rubrivivax sp.]